MKKNIFIISGIIIFIIVILFLCNNYFKEKDYNSAKREAIKFLDNNIEKLEKLSNDMIQFGYGQSQQYKNKSYDYYNDSLNREYVKFEINSQGMLGGQYWGLIYCPTNNLLGENSIEIYDEKEKTGKGNNIFIKEKIKDNWYFYYEDYDGRVDTESIK